MLQGKRCTAYPACNTDVKLAGGTYVDVSADEAIVDGNLVTDQAWLAHPRWLGEFLKLLGSRIEHLEVAKVN